jgi:hypothetical protein
LNSNPKVRTSDEDSNLLEFEDNPYFWFQSLAIFLSFVTEGFWRRYFCLLYALDGK